MRSTSCCNSSSRLLGRKSVQCLARKHYRHMSWCYNSDILLSQQCIPSWTQVMNHKIGQCAVLWMYRDEEQRPFVSRACTLYQRPVIEHCPPDDCLACSSKFSEQDPLLPLLSCPDGHLLGLTLAARDADPLRTARFTDGKQNREHPILEIRFDSVGIDRPRESDHPFKRAGDDFPREPVMPLPVAVRSAPLLRLLSSVLLPRLWLALLLRLWLTLRLT